MENSNQPKIQYNPTLVVIVCVIVILLILLKVVANDKQNEYHQQQEQKLDLQTYQDSIRNYQDSITSYQNNLNQAYKDSIQIIKCYTSAPNSAGGVDLNIVWKNKTHRTIKYVRFGVDPINAVGDVVPCDIRGYDRGFRVTGPVYSGKVDGYGTYWDCAWYNHSIRKAKVRSVSITFMDDSEVEFEM
jgi:type II secretory pathway pseudopilin PulG